MGKIRIKSDVEVKRRFEEIMDGLSDGPIFVARNKRVSAVLMEMSDYYDLLGEIEDLMQLLHTMGGCGCGCEDAEENELDKILDKAFDEIGD
ncbi:MAG: hypothetical protein KGZ63_02620 [Clostridiales bacterium]|nr:hypothetical protein [Clostridiales bacterium]